MHVNAFDASIIHFLNFFAHRWWSLDAFILLFVSNDLMKGAFLTALFWWVWERHDKSIVEHRQVLIFGMLACAVSVLFTRIATLSLPYRARPMHNPTLHFQLPFGVDQDTLANWSSFPSDHMVLYTCLAVTIWLVDRRVGTVALIYAWVLTGVARVYAGYHYPTDILAGMAVGTGFAMLSQVAALRTRVAAPAMRWLATSPPSFYAGMFVCTFGVAEAYGSSYIVLLDLVKICKNL